MRPANDSPVRSFIAELKRRRVLHIGGAYIAGAWLGAEILNFLFDQFHAPGWAYRLIAILFVAGFPLAMAMAWIVQVRDDGSWAIDSSRGKYKTVAVAIVMTSLITAGLAWLIRPPAPLPPEPLSNSIAFVELSNSGQQLLALRDGLEQADELRLIWLSPMERPDDLTSFGQARLAEKIAVGHVAEDGLLNLCLHDVTADDEVWSKTMPVDSVTRIANELLAAMALPKLSNLELMGTGNVDAWEAYLAGKAFAASWNVESLTSAIAEYKRAIQLDAAYERAHTGLAAAIYDLLDLGQIRDNEASLLEKRAQLAVDVALKLDKGSSNAVSLLGRNADNRLMRVQAYERAIVLDPDHYMSYYRYALLMKEDGNLEDAARLINRAALFRPSNERIRAAQKEITALQDSVDDS